MHFGGAPNAYVLVYDRVDQTTIEEGASRVTLTKKNAMKVLGLCYRFTANLLKKSQASRLRVSVPPKIMSEIWAQNYILMRDKISFNQDHEAFLFTLVSDAIIDNEMPVSENLTRDFATPSSYRDAITRLATLYCVNTLSRWSYKEPDERWVSRLPMLYANNVSSCIWFLNLFATTPVLLWEFFFTCPRSDFRNLIGTIASYALQVVTPLEKNLPEAKSADENAILLGSCSRRFMINLAKHTSSLACRGGDFKLEQEGFLGDAFFGVVAHYLFQGPEEARFGYSLELLFKILDVYMADRSPFQPQQHSMNAPVRRPFIEGADLTGVVRSIDLLLAAERPADLQSQHSQMAHEMLENPRFLNNFLLEGPSPDRMAALHSVIRRLCTDSKEMTLAVVEAVKVGLELHSYFKFRAYTQVMDVLLSIDDGLREHRVDMVLSWLLASLEAQRNYWKEMDYLIDYIISIARGSQLVAAWLKESAAKLETLVDWLNEHPMAPAGREDQFGFRLRKSRTTLTFHPRHETWVQSPEYGPHYLSVADKKVALTLIMRGEGLPEFPQIPHPDYSARVLEVPKNGLDFFSSSFLGGRTCGCARHFRRLAPGPCCQRGQTAGGDSLPAIRSGMGREHRHVLSPHRTSPLSHRSSGGELSSWRGRLCQRLSVRSCFSVLTFLLLLFY